MYNQSEVPPHFARSLAAMEEVRAQYSADHERAIADDETRQAAFAKLVEDHRAQDAQSQADREAAIAAAAAEGTGEDQAASELAERKAQRVAKQVAEDNAAAAMFRVEDDTEPVAPAAPPPASPPPASAARHRAWEDDDFSATNWIDAE
ncbi:hypothetical protein [Amycolatopsis sp. Poz14]|uniref:hypothetical protein n=1 Tax=Amycolatopsis sp. Poz14 TaxID=1447705 RepID=UPI000561FE6C|nr:hypothetical protein [Amycolatopsis sp. Poz14]MCG3757919.1 hypothetical protein [Amycolatopsis sp. Poz14]